MRIPLLGGSYEGISTNTSSQECINFYYEPPAPGESHLGAALPVHGAALFDTLSGGGIVRGLLYNPIDNLLYGVADNDFYEITSGASETARGTLGTTTGRVNMALNPSNGEIVVVDGSEARQFDCDTNAFSTISDANFPDTATWVFFLNGYMVVNDPSAPGRFRWSDINDADAYTTANFATAESVPSILKGGIEHNGVIYLLGDTKGELWYNKGATGETFARFERLNVGIVSGHTLQRFDNSVAWLARNEHGELNVVRSGEGYQPQVISTPELSRKWSQLSAVDDAFAYTYILDGHEFYVLTFPTASKTWAYDALTKMWSQRSGAFSGGSWSSATTREKVNCIAFCSGWGGHIVGDYASTGKLWSLEETTYTWEGVGMERRLKGPLLATENEDRLRFSEVQIDIEEGTLDDTITSTDRNLYLYYSKDAGHTYSTGTALDIGSGATTGYATRLMKRKLGMGRVWNFAIYTNTPRKIIVKGAYGRLYNEPKGGFSGTTKA